MIWQTDKAGLQERAGLALIGSLTISATTKTHLWLSVRALTERLTLNVSSTNQWAGILDSIKGEKGKSTRISLCFLTADTMQPAVSTLLLPNPSHQERLYPLKLKARTTPSSSFFCQVFVTATGKVTNTKKQKTWPRAVQLREQLIDWQDSCIPG